MRLLAEYEDNDALLFVVVSFLKEKARGTDDLRPRLFLPRHDSEQLLPALARSEFKRQAKLFWRPNGNDEIRAVRVWCIAAGCANPKTVR